MWIFVICKNWNKIIYKAADAAELIRNKIADALAKSYNDIILKTKPLINKDSRNVEETIITLEKR